jgi:hypothetical protein
MATLYLMFNQREYEKLKSYRLLANNFKEIYDKLEINYYNNNFNNLMSIQERINGLRSETSDYPISFVGRYWSGRVIQKEMDLSWVYKGRNQ